ncbi:MAG: DMT family transporter [Patescibacteria group bacterium]|jgi:drug/metabolite transporter (DMT)-like permease
MAISKERQGEASILSGTMLWSFFPIITALSLRAIPPLVSLGISTFFSAVFFALALTLKRRWPELKRREAFGDILWASIILGVVYYLFYYFGLRYTTPGNAAIIALTEVFFSFVFFHLWHKHYIPRTHIFGAFLVLAGALIVLYPNFHKPQIGDFLVLIAAFIAPLGNFFQQRARKSVSSQSILFIRAMVSFPIILTLAVFFNSNFYSSGIKSVIFYLLLNGFILLGFSKILWIEGIHRISVTKATALSSTSPLLTLFFVWLILHDAPTGFQLLSIIPMCAGVILLGINKKSGAATAN